MKKVIISAVIALSLIMSVSAQTTPPVVTTMELPLGATIAYLKQPPSGIYPSYTPCFFYLTDPFTGKTVEVKANALKMHNLSNEGDWLKGVGEDGKYIQLREIGVIVQLKQAIDAEGRPLKNADGTPKRIYDITF